MLPVVKQVIEVLTSAAEKLESDASRVDAMLPKLPEEEREVWMQTAKDYRRRAAEYRTNVENITADHRKNDFMKPDAASVIR